MEKIDFETSLALTTKALLIAGVRISKTNYRKSMQIFLDSWLYYISLSWLYADIYGEIYWVIEGISIGTNFVELSITAPCIAISMLGTAKITYLYSNMDVVTKVVNKLRDLHPEQDDNGFNEKDVIIDEVCDSNSKNIEVKRKGNVEREIVEESVKFLNNVGNFLFYICLVVIFTFPSMPLIAMAYEYHTTGATDYKYPYLVKYGFNINQLWIWPLVYIHHTVSTVIVGSNVIGSDSLFYALCVYIQMHFRLLSHRLENLVSEAGVTSRTELMQAVRRHQELISLVDQVELLYSKSMLFNIVTSSVLMCLSGFIATVIDDLTVVITFVLFLVMSLSQIFWLCYFGDMIMRSSTEISSAIYHSHWYIADPRTKKSLLLILMRAQKPCKLTAYDFFDLTLQLFASILSRSWSYFALLKTMYNDHHA